MYQHSQPSSTEGAAMPLPKYIVPIRKILDMQGIAPQSLTSVIGLVKDFRAPIPTRGQDFKATITLYDLSTQDGDGLVFFIFRKMEEMPDVGCGDVVCVWRAKVQRFHSEQLSLMTNVRTEIYVFKSEGIVEPPGSALEALRPFGRRRNPPADDICKYVSFLYHSIDKRQLPDAKEFEVRKERSLNIKDKFRELKDVQDGAFYDMVVKVIRDPFDQGDKVTLWVADYTENEHFHLFLPGSVQESEPIYGDPMGYTSKFEQPSQAWSGPFGKRCLQVTCYEPHAEFLRSRRVAGGFWLSLRNVQVKYNSIGSNLEGYLRGDQRYTSAVNIDVLNWLDGENMDPRLKAALRRNRDYVADEKKRRAKLESLAEPTKRKTEDMPPVQVPTRNQRKRQRQKERKAKELEAKERQIEAILNPEVSCENPEKPVSTVSKMLTTIYREISLDGSATITVPLPFNNVCYRAIVRVVDFFPPKLESFSCFHHRSEFDALSDNADDEDDVVSEAEADGTLDRFVGPGSWEWRFDLQLEDASPQRGSSKERIWVHVDNRGAQLLTGLDACDLRRNTQDLANLRHQLSKLWGTLETAKRSELKQKEAAHNGPPPSSTTDSEKKEEGEEEVSNNLAFSCCIRQFGVKVPEHDESKADAGDGKRWERKYGLFGTKVSYPREPQSSGQSL